MLNIKRVLLDQPGDRSVRSKVISLFEQIGAREQQLPPEQRFSDDQVDEFEQALFFLNDQDDLNEMLVQFITDAYRYLAAHVTDKEQQNADANPVAGDMDEDVEMDMDEDMEGPDEDQGHRPGY